MGLKIVRSKKVMTEGRNLKKSVGPNIVGLKNGLYKEFLFNV